jgi:hypothetical protein
VAQTAGPFDYTTISVFYFHHLGFVKGFFFDRMQFETRPNVWPGTIVRLRQLMASDGPVANIKITRHGYDDVIRKVRKEGSRHQMDCSSAVRRLGPTFI